MPRARLWSTPPGLRGIGRSFPYLMLPRRLVGGSYEVGNRMVLAGDAGHTPTVRSAALNLERMPSFSFAPSYATAGVSARLRNGRNPSGLGRLAYRHLSPAIVIELGDSRGDYLVLFLVRYSYSMRNDGGSGISNPRYSLHAHTLSKRAP